MVNKKLRYFRIQCNLTQQEIAKEIGVKRTKVAKWEAGLEEIDEENYKQLAKLFGVSVRRLKGKADKERFIQFTSCNENYEDASTVLYIISFLVFAVGLAVVSVWMEIRKFMCKFNFEESNKELISISDSLIVIIENYSLIFILIFISSIIIFIIGFLLKHIKINRGFEE